MRVETLIVALLFAIPAAGQVPPAPAQKSLQQIVSEDPGAKKAHVLIDQMIQALGGQAFLNVQDMEAHQRFWTAVGGIPVNNEKSGTSSTSITATRAGKSPTRARALTIPKN